MADRVTERCGRWWDCQVANDVALGLCTKSSNNDIFKVRDPMYTLQQTHWPFFTLMKFYQFIFPADSLVYAVMYIVICRLDFVEDILIF